MKLNIKVSSKEITQIKNEGLKEFKNLRIQILPGITVCSGSFGDNLLINLGNDVYGEIYIDNRYYGNDIHSPILYAARWSSMYGLHPTDLVNQRDVLSLEELSNPDLEITEDLIKKLVIAQLKKSFPMFIIPEN